jgi:uncharacterized repeat protein (TIGR01451 family)
MILLLVGFLFVFNVALADAPTAPTEITAYYIADTMFKITWNDTSGDEAGFYLDRNASGAGWVQLADLAADTTEYYDDTTAANAYYSYRVRAYNAGAEESSNATLSSSVYTTPSGIYNLSITFTSGSGNELTWEEDATSEDEIQVYADGVAVASLAANSTTYTHTAGIATTDYQVYVNIGDDFSSTITEEGSSVWLYEHVEPSGLVFNSPKIVIDSAGNYHMIFRDNNAITEKSDLMYGFRENGETTWHYSRVADEGTDDNRTMFLMLDSGDYPNIFTISGENTGLTNHYNMGTDGAWDKNNVLDEGADPINAEGTTYLEDITMDSNGLFHIALSQYNNEMTEYWIKYITYEPGNLGTLEAAASFTSAEVDAFDEVYIKTDTNNSPRIVFTTSLVGAYTLNYTNKDSGSWLSVVEVEGSFDGWLDMFFEYDETNDCDNIIYTQNNWAVNDIDVKHERFCSDVWTEFTVDNLEEFDMVDADIGTNGDVIITYFEYETRTDNYYRMFDASEGTWGAREDYSDQEGGSYQVLFNSGSPLVVQEKTSGISEHPIFRNRNGGAWDTGTYAAYDGWTIYDRDSGNTSFPTSIAVDDNDVPHIIYFKDVEDDTALGTYDTDLQLKHAWKVAGTWNTEIIDTFETGGITQGQISTDITFECGKGGSYDTTVHVALNDGDITYYAKETDTWADTTVVSGVSTQYKWVDIELDSSCNPVIAYTQAEDSKVAVYDGSWSLKMANSENSENATYLAIDATTGDYHLAYSDNFNVYYVYSDDTGDTWAEATVAGSSKWHPTIDVTSANKPAISTSEEFYTYTDQWNTIDYEDDYQESNRYTAFPFVYEDDTPFFFHIKISNEEMGTDTAYALYSNSNWSSTNYTDSNYSPVDDLIKDGIVYSAIGNAEGMGTYYGVSYATSTLGLIAPTTCSFSAVDTTTLTVNWSDNAFNETAYVIEQSTDNSTWSILSSSEAADSTSYDVTSLDAFTQYNFRVKATNAGGDSSYLACSLVTTLAATPATPTLTAPSDSGTEVSVTPTFEFSTTVDGVQTIDYQLQIATAQTFLSPFFSADSRDNRLGWNEYSGYDTGDSVEFTLQSVDTLSTDTTYYWRVRAMSGSGTVYAYSSVYSFTTIASSAEEADDVAFVDKLISSNKIDTTNSTILNKHGSSKLDAGFSFAAPTEEFGTLDSENYFIETFDCNNDGYLDVLSNFGKTNDLFINDGDGTFTGSVSITNVGNNAAFGDFDLDGDVDVITATGSSLYQSNDNCTFTASDITGVTPDYVFTSDIDKDGDLDLLTAEVDPGENNIYLNDGSANFTAISTNPFSGTSDATWDIEIVDLNNDTYPDMIVANWQEQNYLYMNDRDGTFTKSNEFGNSYSIYEVITLDAENDGDIDVIMGRPDSASRIYMNDGSGSFTAVQILPGTTSVSGGSAYAIGDINVDGYTDLIIPTNENSANYVKLNNGDGTFADPVILESTYTGYSNYAHVADMDNDGDDDMLWGNSPTRDQGGNMKLVLNNNEPVFTEEVLEDDGGDDPVDYYEVFSIFDSDLDGDLDWFVLNLWTGYIEIWVNDGSQSYTETAIENWEEGDPGVIYKAVPVDVDGDSDLDIIAAVRQDPNVLFVNNGSNSFTRSETFGSNDSLNTLDARVFDLENDGDFDVAFLNQQDAQAIELWVNNGSGSFTESSNDSVFDGDTAVDRTYFDVGDVDADGDMDIIVPQDTDADLYVNDGSGEFTLSSTLGPDDGESYHSTVFGDFDNDNDLDLVVGINRESGTDSGFLWLNNGAGSFTSGIDFYGIGRPVPIDFDHDGDLDIMTIYESDIAAPHALILNQGNYAFSKLELFGSETDGSRLPVVSDYDLDGDYDVFIRNGSYVETNYNYYHNQTFTTATDYTLQSNVIDNTADDIYSVTLTGNDFTPTGTSLLYYVAAVLDDSWTSFDNFSTSTNLNGVYTWDNNGLTTVAYGDDGFIQFTSDEGDSWTTLSGALENINSVATAGPSFTPVAVGDNGSAYSLSDEGATPVCAGDETENINAVAGTDSNDYAYSAGDSGVVFRADVTADTITCESLVSGTSEDLNGLRVNEDDSVLVAGDNGTLLSSSNGTSFTLFDLGTSEDLNGFASGNSPLYIFGNNGYVYDLSGDEVVDIGAGTDNLINGVDIYDDISMDYTILILGTSGTVYVSEDDGDTWTTSDPGSSANLTGVSYFDDDLTIVVAGASGTLVYEPDSSVPLWEGPVTSGTEYDLTNAGSALYWKVVSSTTNANLTPVVYDVSINYSTTQTVTGSTTTVNIPTNPIADTADILSPTSIQWNFTDTADNEVGFKFYDSDGLLLSTLATPDMGTTIEIGLLPNTSYVRKIAAYNHDGEGAQVAWDEVYTYANVPAVQTLAVTSDTSVNLAIDENENSIATEYAIYDAGTQSWLQANGILGAARVYQTYSEWLDGASAIPITGLTNNAMYSFKIIARNGDDIETDFSETQNIVVYRPANANVVLSKKVGINQGVQLSGVYFGTPVFAGSDLAKKLEYVTIYSELANTYVVISLGVVILLLVLFWINARPRLGHLKHLHKVLFTDFRGQKKDHFFHLFHGLESKKDSKQYKRHHHLYKYTSMGVLTLCLGIALKITIVMATVALVYGSVSVNAFVNESGDEVYENDILTYQVTAVNNGAQSATNVVVTDTIPDYAVYSKGSLVSYDPNGNEDNFCSFDSDVITCTIPEMAPDKSGYFEFQAVVSSSVGETIINSAAVTFAQGAEKVYSNSVSNMIGIEIDIGDAIGPGVTQDTSLNTGWNYFTMYETSKVRFPHESGTHSVYMSDVNDDGENIEVIIESDPITEVILDGKTTLFDSDGDGPVDLAVKTQSIDSIEIATIGIMQVEEEEVDGEVCGNDTCEENETCSNCEADCGACAPEEPSCGDATCNGDETCNNCSADCGVCPPEPVCGDTECNGSESCVTCSADCGICPPPAVCGNSSCESGETCTNCEEDCGICETSPVCGDNLCNGFEDCSTCVEDCGACPDTGSTCGDNTCNEDEDCESCETDCGECEEEEVGPVCGDTVCEGAEVCDVCSSDCGVCPTQGPFCGDSQCNGEETCSSCAVDCNVCEEILDEAIDEVLAGDIRDEDVLIIEDILDEKEEYDKSDKERKFELLLNTKKVVEVLKIEDETVKAAVQTVLKVKQITLDNKIAEKINDVVEEPVIAATAVTSIAAVATVGATGATGASILTYLQFLITTPLGLFSRRKRKGWGIIYNSITKKPLDLAIVRLYNSETKKLVRTRVTDRLGRYQFIVKPGNYYIEVDKKEFAFPSKLLDNQQTDGQFLNVYYGGDIQITEEGVINQPIAVDPNKKDLSNSAVIKRFVLRRVQTVFTLLGPVLALISLVISPSWWIFGLLVAQIVMFVVFKRLATGQKPTSFGTVMDKLKKNPLGRAVVRVFDTKFHKLLDTRITNGKGKYAFLVGNDVYYMTSEKNGYHPHRTDKVDLTSEESGYLAEDIRMTPAGMKLEQGQEDAVAVRSSIGRQEEKQVNGMQKVVRREEESFKGNIKDVKLDDMHEEYYDVDVLSKK